MSKGKTIMSGVLLAAILAAILVCGASATQAAEVTFSGSGTFIGNGAAAANGSLAFLGGETASVKFATGTVAGDASLVQSPAGGPGASSVAFRFDGADLGSSHLLNTTPSVYSRSLPRATVALRAGVPIAGLSQLAPDGSYDLVSVYTFLPHTVFTNPPGTIAAQGDLLGGTYFALTLVHAAGWLTGAPLNAASALPPAQDWLDQLVVAVLEIEDYNGGAPAGHAFAILDPVTLSLGASQLAAPVPLPAGLPLLLSALLPVALAGARRRSLRT